MSGCYLYCVVPRGTGPPAGLTGVSGAPVQGRDLEAFAIWTSALERRPEQEVERVREHHAVVQAALGDVTPLPVRFGEWAPDPDVLLERLEREGDRLLSALECVQGALEFGVRVAPATAAVPPSAEGGGASASEVDRAEDGRSYMRLLARRQAERRELERRRGALLAELRAALGARVRDERPGAQPPDRGASVAHLVSRDEASAYVAAVERFRSARPDLAVDLLGPWPPYSFAP